MDIPDMQHQVMGYDRSATMFSPDGHLLQVEYAGKAVREGTASIGINCSEGVIILADKGKKDELIVKDSANKIYEIDSNIVASASGILSDARILVNQLRLVAQQHRVTYDGPIDVESTVREFADIQQQYTQHPGVRPFGVALIIAGKNENNETKLYTSDITGNYYEYLAIAIGQNDVKIKELLRKSYKKDITIEQAIKLALDIFKKVLGDKFELNRFNLGYLKKNEDKLVKLSEEELKKYV